MMINNTHTDEQLWEWIQSDEEAAFTALYHRYWRLLFSVAVHKLDNLVDAEDVVQDVFTDLWRRRKTIVIHQSIKSFLAGAVKFQVYKLLAKRYKLDNFNLEPDATDAHAFTPEEVYQLKSLRNQLENAVQSLPERCKLIFNLSRKEGMSHKEISDALDISAKTVENHITKALHHLRVSLKALIIFIF